MVKKFVYVLYFATLSTVSKFNAIELNILWEFYVEVYTLVTKLSGFQ